MNRWFSTALTVLSTGSTVALWLAYYALYYKWRHCFNEAGRCFDSETGVVYIEQTNAALLPMALLATCLSGVLLWRVLSAKRRSTSNGNPQ